MQLKPPRALIAFLFPAILGAAPAPATQPDAAAIQLVDQLLAHPYDDPRKPDDTTHHDLLRAVIAAGDPAIAEMVVRLLAMPDAAQDPQGTMNGTRWQLVRDLGEVGDRAIPPLQAALPRAKTSLQRSEITQALCTIRTPAGTQALLLLKDNKDDDIRTAALDGLISRLESGPDQGGDPALLPLLIKLVPAEKVDRIRDSLCAAVRAELKTGTPAEKPDPARVALAASYLRDRLKNDASEEVRFSAACALTEFGDNSGAPEIKKAVLALQSNKQVKDFSLERIVPALERATGQKFGPVPMNPMLSSNTRAVPNLEAQRKELLDKIAQWVKDNETF